MQTTARNATLPDLLEILEHNEEAKLDCVVPATAIRSRDGLIEVDGMSHEAVLGLGPVAGRFRPTDQMVAQIADKLAIPLPYTRRMHAERPDLFDANVNGWLHGNPILPKGGEEAPGGCEPDHRRFLVRSFLNTDPEVNGGHGYGRALLSDSFKPIDHLDWLTAALSGIRESGHRFDIIGGDLSDTRFNLKLFSPDLAAMAPSLLAGYRPITRTLDGLQARYGPEHLGWDPGAGQCPPVVFAGIELSNSETGGGAATICPRLVVLACSNGLKITADLMRMVHLGAKLDEGTIRWSDQTMERNLALVTSMAKDAVAKLMSTEYLEQTIGVLEQTAGTPIADPVATIEVVTKKLGFSDQVRRMVLADFVQGGQLTAGGVMQAFTSVAQVIPDPDLAFDIENSAVRAMELACA